MSAIFKIVASRVNNIEADQYGNVNVEPGQIWYDPDTGVLRLYDGNVGGYIINQGGGGNPVSVDYNGNIVTGNVSTINFTGNGVSVTGSGSNVTVDIIQSAGNYSNANVTALLADFGSNSITTTGNITAANFITTGSNIDAGNVNVTGNVTADYFIGNGSLLTGITASLPSQASNSGKYLYTNGVNPSWEYVPGVFGLVIDGGNAVSASTDFIIDGGGA